MFRRKTSLLGAGAILAVSALSPVVAHGAEDYSESIKMSWDKETYASELEGSFLGGDSFVVPGDSSQRTLSVLNDGPSTGNLRVSITNVELNTPDSDNMSGFYDELKIITEDPDDNSISLADLNENGTTIIGTDSVSQGGVTDVTIGFEFPSDSTQGNMGDAQASFDVLLELGGELPDEPQPPEEDDDEDGNDNGDSNTRGDSNGNNDRNSNANANANANPNGNANANANAQGNQNGNGNNGNNGNGNNGNNGNGNNGNNGNGNAGWNGNGNNGNNGNGNSQGEYQGPLPRTGFNVLMSVMVAGALIVGGAVIRKMTTPKKQKAE